MSITLLLVILAFVFALLAAFSAPGAPRMTWLAVALVLFIASFLIRAV